MARVIVWSPEAVEDIEAVAAYIGRDSPWYARAVASKIVETAESIPEYPELGRMVPEIDDPATKVKKSNRRVDTDRCAAGHAGSYVPFADDRCCVAR